jgi:hypothetical protein
MPLHTSITRDGEQLSLRWGDFHVAAMALASMFDSGTGPCKDPSVVYEAPAEMFECYPDAPFPVTRRIAFELTSYPVLGLTPLNFGAYTLKGKHKFMDLQDGEVLELLPGDELRAVRN